MTVAAVATSWPVGLAATVLAGVLLWTVSGRLHLRPETRAASTALFACGALLSEATTLGVDGRATLLLTAAAVLASAGRVRSILAALAAAGAVALAPVVAVGMLVLLGGMALTRDLAARLPVASRRLLGGTAVALAVALAALLARRGAADPDALAVSPPVTAALLAATALVGGVLWARLPWIRPPVAAVAALAACVALPGAGPEAVLPVTAGIAVLLAVAVEERPFARPVLVGATVAGVVATVAVLAPLLSGPAAPPRPPQPQVQPAAELSAPGPVAPARPVSLEIPALELAGPLAELTRADDGELFPPADPGRAGWYAAGVVPGEIGPAVIGGHVDSRSGPGVFSGLRTLRAGDAVTVVRADGRRVRFAVTSVRTVPKDRFPTEAVYAPTPRPELRLITCGGPFNRAASSYADNVVVDAELVDPVTDRGRSAPVRGN